MRDAALEDLQLLRIGFLRLEEDDLVDMEGGLVEYDFGLWLLWREVDCLGDEEVDRW